MTEIECLLQIIELQKTIIRVKDQRIKELEDLYFNK